MEIVSIKRKDIPHLRDMNDYEFMYWLIHEDPLWTPRVHQKLDGFFGRFGKDSNGDFFFQTARSDVLRDPIAVIWYALDRGYTGVDLVRAKHIAEMYNMIRSSRALESMSKGTAVSCEFFYKPMATRNEDGTLTFVNVSYFEDAFDKDLTIYVHSVTDLAGNEVHTPFPFIEQDDIKIHSSRLNLSAPVDLSWLKAYANQWEVADLMMLSSRKQIDRARKLELKGIVSEFKEELRSTLLKSESIQQLPITNTHEGLVFHINEKQYKVINESFRSLINVNV